MGSGASSQTSQRDLKNNDLFFMDPESYSTHDNSDASSSCRSADDACSYNSLCSNFQHVDFIKKVRKDIISLDETREYLTLYPQAVFGTDYVFGTAIKYAADNKNIPLFYILMEKKLEINRAANNEIREKFVSSLSQ